MKRLLLIGMFLTALVFSAFAQKSTQLILRSNDGSKTYTIKRGDFVKIRMKEPDEKVLYRGTFRRYENGLVYLKGKPGIPVDQVQNISYRPLAARIMFWGLLLLGAMLVDIGFLSVFAVAGSGPLNMVKAGFAIIGLSVILQIGSLNHARDIAANWTIEQWSPPLPAQKLAPIP